MSLTTRLGKRLSYRGAIVFADDPLAHNTGFVAVSGVILPHPSADELHNTLKKLHDHPPRSTILLRVPRRESVVAMLEAFCNEGAPLGAGLNALETDLHGITTFQKHVYQLTCSIPHGETRPYTWLAHKMKRDGAERAVGRALCCNPFPLLVPCHRVVKKNGNLGGFMGDEAPTSWQVHLKRALLDLEEQHRQPSLFSGA